MTQQKTKIISVVNQKGGVGKTTTVINLATIFTAIGKKVLVIDLDPQGNTSTGFGIGIQKRNINSYDVITEEKDITESITKTRIPGLDLITATMDLAAAEMDLANVEGRAYKLKNQLIKVVDQYEYIFIDCPPSLGLLTLNALCASNKIIIPLQCEFFALEGLTYLFDTIERIKANFNPKLDIDGVLLTMYDRRNRLTEQVEEDARNCLGEMIYKTIVPRNIRLSEASSYGIPGIIYDSNSPGAIAYMELGAEIIDRNKKS